MTAADILLLTAALEVIIAAPAVISMLARGRRKA